MEPRTPERDRHSQREQQHLQQLQMTSPSIRRQRQSDIQDPIPQPDFGGPAREQQTGTKCYYRAFNPDMLFDCKIMGDDVQNQMRAYLLLDFLYLYKAEWIKISLWLGLLHQ